jgi:hypothetical protein
MEDGSLLVRGYKLDSDTRAQLTMPSNEDGVIVPASLIAQLSRQP